MTPITDYCTTAEVRACLGVSSDELSDTTVNLAMYAISLNNELEDIADDLPTTFATIKAIVEGSRTSAQKRLYNSVSVFAPYAVARQLASSVPLFSPKDITDGKAAVTRFADSPYREVLRRVDSEYERWKALVASAVAGLTSSTAGISIPTLFAVSSPDSDPVEGT